RNMGTTVFGFTCIVNYLNMPSSKTVPSPNMGISTMFRFVLNSRKKSTTNQKRGFLNLLQLELIIPPVNFILRVMEPKGNTLNSIGKCRNALQKNSYDFQKIHSILRTITNRKHEFRNSIPR